MPLWSFCVFWCGFFLTHWLMVDFLYLDFAVSSSSHFSGGLNCKQKENTSAVCFKMKSCPICGSTSLYFRETVIKKTASCFIDLLSVQPQFLQSWIASFSCARVHANSSSLVCLTHPVGILKWKRLAQFNWWLYHSSVHKRLLHRCLEPWDVLPT